MFFLSENKLLIGFLRFQNLNLEFLTIKNGLKGNQNMMHCLPRQMTFYLLCVCLNNWGGQCPLKKKVMWV